MTKGWAPLAVLVLALAGCAEEAPTDSTVVETETGTMDETVEDEAPPPERFAVQWDGALGTRATVCETQVVQSCEGFSAVPDDDDYYLEELGRVRSVDLLLEWDAQSPATEGLGFGVMVMATECEECNSTMIGTVTGTSPLSITATDLDLEVLPGMVVHAYVWNEGGWQYHNGVYTYTTPDNAFTVTGNVTMLPP